MIRQTRQEMADDKRVVITGIGVVSSLGLGWTDFWRNLLAGRSGIAPVEYVDTTNYERHFAGEIKEYDRGVIRKSRSSTLGCSALYAIDAVRQALQDARVDPGSMEPDRVAICVGTTMGEAQAIEALVMGEVNHPNLEPEALLALTYPAQSIVANLAYRLGARGGNMLFANACAAGNYAVGHGYDQIVSGEADYVITGGVDSLSRIAFTGFSRLFAMAPERCQPFDRHRQGMMLGEGAGILLLESLQSARKRGAPIYAELLGYGLSCDARHMTNPSEVGVAKAISKALVHSGCLPEEVDYVCAHGTGTMENDKAESHAISSVFGERAIPVSSIKSMLGHTMGAASALETIACALTLREGIIPPTINLNEMDEACPIDCVANKARPGNYQLVVNNSQAFGGNNSVLVMRKI